MAEDLPVIPFIRGDNFLLAGTINLPQLGTWTATSKVKDLSGVQVADLTVTLTPPVAPSVFYAVAIVNEDPTTDWPVGPLACDVLFTLDNPATAQHSSRFIIGCAQGVT